MRSIFLKFGLFLTGLSLFLVPLITLAKSDEELTGSTGSEITSLKNACEASSKSCSCVFSDGSGESDSSAESFQSLSQCASWCEARNPNSTLTSCTVQTCDSVGTLIDTNCLGAATSSTSNSDFSKKAEEFFTPDTIIPILNVPIPGLDFENQIVENELTGEKRINLLGIYVKAVYGYVLVVAAILAVLMVMVGGFQYLTAAGSTKAIGAAKERIRNASMGIVLLMFAYTIAFLIDPSTLLFGSLNVRDVTAIEYIPSEGEETDVSAVSVSSSDNVKILGEHLSSQRSDNFINKDLLAKLTAVSNSFYEKYGKNLSISSAGRTLEKQATLFYDNCIAGNCRVPTCNPAKGHIITSNQSDKAAVIAELVANGNIGNCPHSSGLAVDVWVAGESYGSHTTNPAWQAKLVNEMINGGFCRLKSEVWHFELVSNPLSTACSTNNTGVSYTLKSGKTYNPPSNCKRWDFADGTESEDNGRAHTCTMY